MKDRFFEMSLIILIGSLQILITSCDKKEVSQIPELTTINISEITQVSVKTGGKIISNGGSEILSYGICIDTSTSPIFNNCILTDTIETSTYVSSISGLKDNTKYYLRAYATNKVGTAYGNEISFTTLPFNTYEVTDIDGYIYKALTIGTQDWFAENLKTTHYANGDIIPDGTGINHYTGLKPYWFAYEHDLNNVQVFGRLYSWLIVNDNRNICPDGWHVPTSDEWNTLTMYLGGAEVAGGKLKESGSTHWRSINIGATNETGFTALPGGYFYPPAFNYFIQKEVVGYWWLSTEFDEDHANHVHINYQYANLYAKSWPKTYCFSVRCIKD